MKRVILINIFIMMTLISHGNITLPKIFSNNMVLQRESRIAIWGWADKGERVTVQFLSQTLKTVAGQNGKWQVEIIPVKAGGPYRMIINGKNSITLENVLIGDVWIASGQSNMAFPLMAKDRSFLGAFNSENEVKNADFPEVRFITAYSNPSFEPQKDIITKGWQVCDSASAADFSAIGYYFARDLNKIYNIPIGIINISVSGSSAECWVSEETLQRLQMIDQKQYTDFRMVKPANENLKYKLTQLPGYWMCENEFKGFQDVVWFKKEITIPNELEGKPVTLNLGHIIGTDTTYFNGKLIGYGNSIKEERKYKVPGKWVQSGNNLIMIHLSGTSTYGGIMSKNEDLYLSTNGVKIPLEGSWVYHTNMVPDTLGKPIPPAYAMQIAPTVLYNSMIAPLIPFSIKGVIWYQGESNSDRAKHYKSLFSSLINEWRGKWGNDFSFLFVQLAGYRSDQEFPDDYSWAELRESQAKTLSLPKTGMAVAIDIGDEKNIHPRNKEDVATRLFLAARKVAYNEDIVYSGPTISNMKIEGDKIRISFNNIGSGLSIIDKYGYIKGLSIAGVDKKFLWARGFVEGNDIIVYSDVIQNPVAVRYDWGNTPDGNIYNKEGLPAVPFRTDEWMGISLY